MGKDLIGLIMPLIIIGGLLWVVLSVGGSVAIFIGIVLFVIWLLTK